MTVYVEAVITAENTFSGTVRLRGNFHLSLSGLTDTGTVVHVQRSYDGGSTWKDIEKFTKDAEVIGEEAEGAHYRFGVKTGNYVAGPIEGRLAQ